MTVFGLLAGCAKEPAAGPSENPGTGNNDPQNPAPSNEPFVYYWVRSNDDVTLNPHDASTTGSSDVVNRLSGKLFDFLPSEDGTRGELVPFLAGEFPTVDETGKVWTIKMNPNAKWANGETINAKTFEYSFQMLLNPAIVYSAGASFASNFITIVNALDYVKQGTANSVKWEDVGIKAIDDLTLQITCTEKYTQNEFMRHFATYSAAPVYEPIYSKCISADGSTCDYGSSMEKFMCSGPFMLESYTKASEAIMVKNPYYTKADMVHIDKVVSRLVTDESTRLELFEKGEADHVFLGTNGMAKYGEDPRVASYPNTSVETIEVNQNNPDKEYLKDPIFRKALFYAIDRNAIAKLSNNIAAPYFFSLVGQALDDGTMYRDLPEAKALVPENGGYNPELAKKYLDETLKKYNLSKITVNLMYTETSDARRMASEYIQSSLEKLFGTDKFSMTLSANSFSLLNETMRSSVVGPTNAWDLCWSAWGLTAEKTHPYKKGERYTTWYARRYTTYQNTVIDTLWEQCLIEENRLDDEKMASITVAMEKAILDDMTCVPVYQPNNFVMYADRIDLPMNVYHNDIGFGWTYSKLK